MPPSVRGGGNLIGFCVAAKTGIAANAEPAIIPALASRRVTIDSLAAHAALEADWIMFRINNNSWPS
jgi:hypothetical protein